ncbi:MAG: hypothetical protein UX82_C0017G0011 [Microgenomates group bacterium GW2011_GWE1_47_12]|uniref:Putative gluconeogenesis factor n=2 Tax=Candidatus Collieribacteriota TaxID=1752725 RepID=A0A1F5FX68_9BACT|nr:MAG: hypothetical protein UX40_C0011G0033 [Microgenomates group bacterium GW2011_GWF2_46_18]KKU44690.1 MAG: hypothetical protein UX63_C0025G0011 [Microgenomates group bacterium GW2011_GWB1_46_7]KKU60262.1 MAG: hypothetical protein UX82_C0017G0011 [Microgenomates group bacterium GW2011_GWE1_47_12]KKU62420.1 MAG: hypothetical protein UX84_C0007G0006 [Microgenomates group bacterium GW2011_GWD1_47_13]OGD70348.1 MAG: hypothetical protein A2187_00320 [Candidatus Collierbacteria bacterium RIFOXYA1_
MKKKIVVIGGGTGTYTVLRGLKKYNDLEISAIVTMADDGGSNKVLRDEFGLLPTSGVRQCMVALSANEGILRKLFSYRYYQGVGISGMTFGNLFMAAVSDVLGDQRGAIKETAKLLDVRGKILPISYDKVSLLATYTDGTEILGEHLIDLGQGKVGKQRIKHFRTIPKTRIDSEAKRAIAEADMIVLGPGDLYTNTMANLVVTGTVEAIVKSQARVVFVMNVMTKKGESYGYGAQDFLIDLGKYLPLSRVNYVVVNTDQTIEKAVAKAYAREEADWVKDNLDEVAKTNDSWQVIRGRLLAKGRVEKEKGDKLARSMVRHDPDKLAKILVELLYV